MNLAADGYLENIYKQDSKQHIILMQFMLAINKLGFDSYNFHVNQFAIHAINIITKNKSFQYVNPHVIVLHIVSYIEKLIQYRVLIRQANLIRKNISFELCKLSEQNNFATYDDERAIKEYLKRDSLMNEIDNNNFHNPLIKKEMSDFFIKNNLKNYILGLRDK